MTTNIPQEPGLHWAVLDDGNGNTEIVLLRVSFYKGLSSFDEGVVCDFVDGTDWGFDLRNFDQEIVRPGRVAYAASRGAQHREEFKITWHGPALPPASALQQKPVIL